MGLELIELQGRRRRTPPDREKLIDGRIVVNPVCREILPPDAQGKRILRTTFGRRTGEGSQDFEAYFFIHQPESAAYFLPHQQPIVEVNPQYHTRYTLRAASKLDSVITTATHVSLDVEEGTEVGTVIAGHPKSDIRVYNADAIIATHGGRVTLLEKATVALAQGGKIDARTADIDRGIVTTAGELLIHTAGEVSLAGAPASPARLHLLRESFVDKLIRGSHTRISLPMFRHFGDFTQKSVVEGSDNRMSENILDEDVPHRPRGLADFGEPEIVSRDPIIRTYPETIDVIARRLFDTDICLSRIEPFWEALMDDHAHDPESAVMRNMNLSKLYETNPDEAMKIYRAMTAANEIAEAAIRALATIEDPDPRQRRMYDEERPRDETFRGMRSPDDPTVQVRRQQEREFLERVDRHVERQELERVPVRTHLGFQPQELPDGRIVTPGMDGYEYPPVRTVVVGESPARKPLIRGRALALIRRGVQFVKDDIALRNEIAAAIRAPYEQPYDRRTLQDFSTELLY